MDKPSGQTAPAAGSTAGNRGAASDSPWRARPRRWARTVWTPAWLAKRLPAGATAAAQRTIKGKPRDDVGKGTTAKSEDGKQNAEGKKEQRKKFPGIF